jgi:two-component system chemotaxis sensor kinase CheA
MFFEEARELLISLEEGLMDLERRQGDRAHLDKTFRAAHSLKGAAAMVGLEPIARFTHGIEAVLEKIRGGNLAVDSDIITTLLESRDHLAAMVEGEAAGSPVPGSGDLSYRLGELLRGAPQPGVGPSGKKIPSQEAMTPTQLPTAPPASTSQVQPTQPPWQEPSKDISQTRASLPAAVDGSSQALPPVDKPATPKPKTRRSKRPNEEGAPPRPKSRRGKARAMDQVAQQSTRGTGGPSSDESSTATPSTPFYLIKLTPGADTLRRGVNPLGVLDELRELGETTISTDPALVPLIDVFDPEQCYLSWTITLKTDSDPERLRDVFLFVAEDSTVTVERQTADGTFVELPLISPEPQVGTSLADMPVADSQVRSPEITPSAPTPETSLPTQISDAKGTPTTSNGVSGAVRTPSPGVGAPLLPVARPHARIRVDALQLDELVGLAGELAVLSDNLQGLRDVPSLAPWLQALESLQRVSRQIRDTTLELRMVPVDELFSRFPRVVRDLADRSGKEIELKIVGQETRLDRTIVERLADPMVHLIRNAVDHALETPPERKEKGKPRLGKITLAAGHEGDRVAIRVEDDGRGLDREKIVRKGITNGLIPSGTSPDDPRVVNLIFEPGFSTRETVSEMSGRGVGLDVVRDSVRALRGSLSVESAPNKGTSFVFRLPLTLALIDGLLVETAGGKFVVPLAQVDECVSLNGTSPALARERPCVSVRGELVPMISLRKLFRSNGPLPPRQELLLTRHAGQKVGVAVDRLVGRVQAVIQSLGGGLHGLSRFSGATILGDGSVSLILDLSALVSESLVADHGVHVTPSGGVRAESFR